MARASAISNLDADDWLSLLFAAWLLLSVTLPDTLYRTFFHALIYPLTLYLLFRKGRGHVCKDPFMRLFLVFCGYMATTTWLVGEGPVKDDLQAVRWGAEAALGMLAFFLWMGTVTGRERLWGRWLLWLALIGTGAGLLSHLPEALGSLRMEGLGVMGHPIQGASIATVLLATGLLLTFHGTGFIRRRDVLLAALTVASVFTFVILSKSRGPVIALSGYLALLTLLLIYRYRRPETLWMALLATAAVAGLVQWLFGFGELYDQLVSRGSSYRLDIWTAYLTHPPESLFLGNGAGMDFALTDASRQYLEPRGLTISHPHNIWIGAFVDTGLIGVAFLAGLLLLPAMAVFRSPVTGSARLHLLAILGLFFVLTFTDEYTLLISLHPVWYIGWIPLVFVWTRARHHQGKSVTAAPATVQGGQQAP